MGITKENVIVTKKSVSQENINGSLGWTNCDRPPVIFTSTSTTLVLLLLHPVLTYRLEVCVFFLLVYLGQRWSGPLQAITHEMLHDTELEYYPSASPAPLAQNWHSPFMASYSSGVRVFISPLWWESQNKCSKWLPTFITTPLKMRSFSPSAWAYFGTPNRSNVQWWSGKILQPLTGEGNSTIMS